MFTSSFLHDNIKINKKSYDLKTLLEIICDHCNKGQQSLQPICDANNFVHTCSYQMNALACARNGASEKTNGVLLECSVNHIRWRFLENFH